MRASLAERLLATVLEWSTEDISRERPLLDVLARLKYDEYQQFSPGMRFIESLAYWLSQFRELKERQTAYRFFKSNLIFCSAAEMNHLVSLAYPDHIRPFLLRKLAGELGLNRWHLPKAAERREFALLERQTLYLGLSDGARTDIFRRYNPNLSHEQVRLSHEIAEERVEKLIAKLSSGLSKILNEVPSREQTHFRAIVLLDDLSASGISYLRQENGKWEGKIGSFLQNLLDPENAMSQLVNPADLDIFIVLYMATERATSYLEQSLETICEERGIRTTVAAIYPLDSKVRIERGQDSLLDEIIDAYYDPINETASTNLGGTDLKYGFAGCGLPLVLSHNTPNNSIGLLWAGGQMRPLFPRITRHKDRV